MLALFVLAGDDDAGFVVGQADGGGGLVDVLAAGPAGVEDVLAVVVGLEFDFHVLRLGHHGHGGGGGVDAALGLGFGDALDAVAAALELELAEGPFPFQAQDDLLEPAQLGRRHVEDLDLPAVVLGVVLVHFVEVAGEQGRLLAAGAGADFQDAAGAVGVLAADGHVQQVVPERFPLGLQLGQLPFGQLAQLGVVPLEHLQGVADLGVEALEAAVLGGQLGQRAVLAHHGRQPGRIGQHLRIGELPFEFLEAGEFFVQRIGHESNPVGCVHATHAVGVPTGCMTRPASRVRCTARTATH